MIYPFRSGNVFILLSCLDGWIVFFGVSGCSNIRHLTNLTSLIMDGCKALTDGGLVYLTELKSLETLSLAQVPRQAEDIMSLPL